MRKQDLIKLAILGAAAGGFISATCGGGGPAQGAPVAGYGFGPNAPTPSIVPSDGIDVNDRPPGVHEDYVKPDYPLSMGGSQPQNAPRAEHSCKGKASCSSKQQTASGCGETSCQSQNEIKAGRPQTAQMKAKRQGRK